MIRCLVSGVLHLDPVQRVSQSGKPFTTAKLRADSKDGQAVWCSLIAFNAEAERLAGLKAGDGLSVSGRCEVQAWLDKNGEPKGGLSVVVDELVTLKAKPKPREESRRAPRRSSRPSREPQPETAGAPLDDLDGWQP